MSEEKLVYTVVCADYFHYGHSEIIRKSSELGKLIVGVMTDEAMASYKRVPMLPYDKRAKVVERQRGVWKVVPQHTLDYTDNLREYKPDIVTNADDWREGRQKETRAKVIKVLKGWSGQLVEFSYTKGISSSEIINEIRKNGVTPEERMCRLRRLINTKDIVRVIEAHSGISALIAENTTYKGKEFDAIWESSFTDSSSKGKPDIELVDFTSRIQTINEILEVTTKPMIVDLDTGGQTEHFKYMIQTLERLGVSAVIIEDKKFPKRNSLMENVKHEQETINKFVEKIEVGKKARVTKDFMIIARIESLIIGKGMSDAILRAKMYIKAGADAIMIHSKKPTGEEIVKFCEEYNQFHDRVPLVIVPTTYCTFTERQMKHYGVSVVIYANHLLRASYKAMKDVAEDILIMECCNVKDKCEPVKEIFKVTNKGVE